MQASKELLADTKWFDRNIRLRHKELPQIMTYALRLNLCVQGLGLKQDFIMCLFVIPLFILISSTNSGAFDFLGAYTYYIMPAVIFLFVLLWLEVRRRIFCKQHNIKTSTFEAELKIDALNMEFPHFIVTSNKPILKEEVQEIKIFWGEAKRRGELKNKITKIEILLNSGDVHKLTNPFFPFQEFMYLLLHYGYTVELVGDHEAVKLRQFLGYFGVVVLCGLAVLVY
ncbi:MAG: hypothetical protein HAW67_01400 [Endozoicomonadaceae bacterium]|nr:hypothetical protein [Endozoicomonadaceae bacterium]